MKRVQKFMGVADNKPASAPIPSSSGSHFSNGSSVGSSHIYDQPGPNLQVPHSAQPSQLSVNSYTSASSSSRAGSNPPSPSPQHRDYQTSTVKSTNGQQLYFDPQQIYHAAVQQQQQHQQQQVSPARPHTPLQNIAPISPTAPSASDANSIERNDLHKTLKAIEGLLVNLDEYRDLAAKMAKVEKKLARSANELEKVKSVKEAPSQTLQVSAAMFETLHEVSSKHSKQIQKEYEALNEACAKYFKKVAKEERAHDELIETLDAKIKKAHASHEKNVKKGSGPKAIENHDKYIATVQGLTSDISRAKASHAASMGTKSHATVLMAASTIGGLSDLDFRTHCESVRRVGPYVGRLNEWLSFSSSEAMPAMQPIDIDETEVGHAQFLLSLQNQAETQAAAQAEAQARAQEDVQAALRAQQMGWYPPTSSTAPQQQPQSQSQSQPQPQPTATIMLTDLPKLDENGQLVSQQSTSTRPAFEPVRAPSPAVTEQGKLVSDRASVRSQPSQDEDARSIRSVQPAAPQPDDSAAPVSAPKSSDTNGKEAESKITPQQTLAPPSGGARLDRAPTGSTMKSMAVLPEEWESSSQAAREDEAEPEPEPEPEAEQRERLGVVREASDARPPSLSHSNSIRGSEDGTRIPRTPEESESLAPVSSAPEPAPVRPTSRSGRSDAGIIESRPAPEPAPRSILENGHTMAEPRSILEPGPSPTKPTAMRPAERALGRYHELGSPRYPAAMRGEYVDSRPAPVLPSDEYARARKLSLWEREREREREREAEMQYRRAYSRPPPPPVASAPMTAPVEPYDPERYEPTVGQSRVSVSRSMSTDSERSFVARMKARYQEERELERRRVYQPPPPPPSRRYAEPPLSRPSEFGAYEPPPHSEVCGCERCSIRHYAARPVDYNVRRQTLPARDLYPPPSAGPGYARRSFDEQDRKVVFAQAPQTIR